MTSTSSFSEDRTSLLKSGQELAGYQLQKPLEQGTFFSNWQATHLALKREVKLSFLQAPWNKQAEDVADFLGHAKRASRLEDQFIAPVYDLRSETHYCFIASQLPKGEKLAHFLTTHGRLKIPQALTIIEEVAHALKALHQQGIVFGNLKPSDVLISEKSLAAKDLQNTTPHSLSNFERISAKLLNVATTPFEVQLMLPLSLANQLSSCAYLAPEQSDYARPVDHRADIYSLGVLAYHVLTGSPPFYASSQTRNLEILARHHYQAPLCPSILNQELPLTLSRIILRMLEKRAEDRYQKVSDILEELRLFERQSLPVTPVSQQEMNLAPPVLIGGKKLEEQFQEALVLQAQHFSKKQELKPLAQLLPSDQLQWKLGHQDTMSSELIELQSDAFSHKKKQTLFECAQSRSEHQQQSFLYRKYFKVHFQEYGTKIRIEFQQGKPLQAFETHYLFDFIEHLNWNPKEFSFVFHQDTILYSPDLRLVIDLFNLCDARNIKFALIAQNLSSYDLLLALGLAEHVELILELEAPDQVSSQSKQVKKSSALQAEGNQPELSPTLQALIENIKEALDVRNPEHALRLWKELRTHKLSDPQKAFTKPLRERIFDEILRKANQDFYQEAYQEAEAAYGLLLELNPERFEGHFGKGLVLKKQNQLQYADAFLTQAILAAPDIANIFYHRALVRSRMGNDAQALRDLNMAIEHDPRHANSYYNRSLLYRRFGKKEKAKRDLLLAQKLRPELKQKQSTRKLQANPAQETQHKEIPLIKKLEEELRVENLEWE